METNQALLKSTIDDLLKRWPDMAEIFIDHQMYCPGCFMSSFDTLEDVLEIYALPEELFLCELNQIVQANT